MASITEKIDFHTHIPKDKLIECPPFPDAIKIEITSRCNYKCVFCAQSLHLREQGNIDATFLHRILHEAKSIGVKEIGMFLLGESLVVKELEDHIRYAKENAKIEYVFLTTNGYLATPKRIVSLIDSGLDSLKFSVNSGSREKYAKMHGVDGFDKVIENIKWCGDYKKKNGKDIKLSVSCIYNEDDLEELEDLKKSLLQYVDEFYYLPLYNQGGHVKGEKATLTGNPGRFGNMVDPVPCWGLFNSAKISWNGWMTSCYFDHGRDFEIADLNSCSLMEAWHHPKFVELRKAHLSKEDSLLKNTVCAKCLGLNQ
jgi:MoaA/NifB/PqqE/SkfB family radical SAM enzyme